MIMNMKRKLTFILLIIFPFWVNGQFQQQSDNSLRVEGVFITKEKPEKVNFVISVKNQSFDFKNCSDSLLIIITDISGILIENGIDKAIIRVSEIAVNENYEYESNIRTRQGFIGSARIEIQDNFSKNFTEKIFKSINLFKYEIGYNVKFSLSEEQKEKLRKISLEKAMDDAKQKAEIIAIQNDLELIKINRITLDEISGFGYRQDQYDLVKEEEIIPITRHDGFYSELELNPKEISIVKTVFIEWKIKKVNK